MTSIAKWVGCFIVALSLVACQPATTDEASSRAERERQVRGENANFAHEYSDIPVDEAVRYGVLENGMRYAIMPNETPSGMAAVRLNFNMGSLAERDDQRGLAHFIEHMAFNGTTNIPEGELIPLLERYGLAFGADSNASTGFEQVQYQLDLPRVDEEVVDAALLIMRETASEMTLDAEAIDRERGIILSEERSRNTPVFRFYKHSLDFALPDMIIADRFPIGDTEVIRTAPRDAFVDYYEDYYTPERAFLVVVGDVDPDEIEAKIEAQFASWQQPENAPGDPDLGIYTTLEEPVYSFFYDPEIYTLVTVEVSTPGQAPLPTVANAREEILRYLGNAIVERRLQSRVNSGESALVQAQLSYDNHFDTVNAANVLGVSSPGRWEEGLAEIEQELRRAIEYGFTQDEMDEQLANIVQGWRNAASQAGTRHSSGLANEISQDWLGDEVFTHPSTVYNWLNTQTFTPEDVHFKFKSMWKAAAPSIVVAAPVELQDGPAQIREAWLASNAEPVEPLADSGPLEFAYTQFGEAGKVETQSHIDDLDFEQITFDNGVKLNVKMTDFEDDTVRVYAHFGSGALTPQPVPAASRILGSVLVSGGVGQHTWDELQRIMAGKSVGIDFGVQPDAFYFQGTTTPEDLTMQMQLLAAYMTDPGWRVEALTQYRTIAEEVRRGQRAQAVQVALNRVSRLLREGDTRWGYPTAEETANFTMDHARMMLAPALESAPIEITIVGDTTLDKAIRAVSETFGALPERDENWPVDETAREVRFPAPTQEPIELAFNGQDYQAMVNVYWPTSDGKDAYEQRVLGMLRAVMDLKSTEILREELGNTYSPIVSNVESRVYTDYGYFWLGLEVDVDQIEPSYEALASMVEAVRRGEVSEDEFSRARTPILEEIEELRENNSFWLSNLRQAQSEPGNLDRLRQLEEHYRSVTLDEVIEAAQRYLTPDTAYKVTIAPERYLETQNN